MSEFRLLGEVADQLGVAPSILSTAFYQRQLDREKCPLKGRCRLIPVDYIPEIRKLLIAKGKLPPASKPGRKPTFAKAG